MMEPESRGSRRAGARDKKDTAARRCLAGPHRNGMAIRREEEKLGAFTLFRHFLRLLGFVRGQRWLLAACVVGSMAQAGIELSLPLLTRRGIDGYVLPPS